MSSGIGSFKQTTNPNVTGNFVLLKVQRWRDWAVVQLLVHKRRKLCLILPIGLLRGYCQRLSLL